MRSETIIHKCDKCGVTKTEVRSGVVECLDYYCVDCGLVLTATKFADDELSFPAVRRIMEA